MSVVTTFPCADQRLKAQISKLIDKGEFTEDSFNEWRYYSRLEDIFLRFYVGEITDDEAINQINSDEMKSMRPEYSITHAVELFIKEALNKQ